MAAFTNDYQITIDNLSNTMFSLSLLYDVPASPMEPFRNFVTRILASSSIIPREGTASFSIPDTFYAMYGKYSTISDGSVQIDTGDSMPAKLGPDGLVAILTTEDGAGVVPKWDKTAMAAGRKTPAHRALVITTDDTFSSSLDTPIHIGVGHRDILGSGGVTPLITLKAGPNLYLEYRPEVKFYICVGEYQSGTVVDRATVGKYLQVDFTNCTECRALFTLDGELNYAARDMVAANGIKWHQRG